jgi:hypothetical protein
MVPGPVLHIFAMLKDVRGSLSFQEHGLELSRRRTGASDRVLRRLAFELFRAQIHRRSSARRVAMQLPRRLAKPLNGTIILVPRCRAR